MWLSTMFLWTRRLLDKWYLENFHIHLRILFFFFLVLGVFIFQSFCVEAYQTRRQQPHFSKHFFLPNIAFPSVAEKILDHLISTLWILFCYRVSAKLNHYIELIKQKERGVWKNYIHLFNPSQRVKYTIRIRYNYS